VTRSLCPRTFTRSTANPLSALKKVTRSTRPAISSDAARGCGEESFILIEVYSVGAHVISASWHQLTRLRAETPMGSLMAAQTARLLANILRHCDFSFMFRLHAKIPGR
jgi:hypothetical protein